MSREILRSMHGMVARRTINSVAKEVSAYLAEATIVRVNDIDVIIACSDRLALKKIATLLKVNEKEFNKKYINRVAIVHSSSVTLTDTGWEKQTPVQLDDYDPDDEL